MNKGFPGTQIIRQPTMEQCKSLISNNYTNTTTGNSKHLIGWCRQYIKSLSNASVQLYKLPTVTLARKYIGLGDLPLAVANHFMTTKSKENDASRRILFISSPAQYLIAHRAMRQHITQLVWFRWLYVVFSRYMIINELIMVQV